MNSLQILSFVGFTLLVAVITWWKVRKTDTGSQQGYFLAGRSLKAPVIAASLMLTNLSTEQLVGLSGQAYKSGMSVMGWEVTSAVTLIFLALIFLPRYLKRGIATIPDFLEERYDKTTRIIIDFCFLIATGVCFLPIVLYSGALALNSLFHVGESLQISHGAAIWLLVILLGLAGILYAVIGGLRAMAVADSINGIGLVIGGLMVPLFALAYVGGGDILGGLTTVVQAHPEKFNAIGGPNDPVPFATMFTGASPEVHGIRHYEKPVLKIDTLFDAWARAGKKVALVSKGGQSIPRIFAERNIDYFITSCDAESVEKGIELIASDKYDIIEVYNQEYDDMLHVTHPRSYFCLRAAKHYVNSYVKLYDAVKTYWKDYTSLITFSPDHGAHRIGKIFLGTHGSEIPSDMNIVHFFSVLGGNDE